MDLFNKLKEKRFTEHKEFYAKMRELNIPRDKKKEYFKEAYQYILGIKTGCNKFYKEAFDEISSMKLKGKKAINELCDIRKREIKYYARGKRFNKNPIIFSE